MARSTDPLGALCRWSHGGRSADSALALSWIADDPRDIRPSLLLVLVAEDLHPLPAVVAYGTDYIATWCRRMRLLRSLAAIRTAVVDALLRIWRRRAPKSADDRARELHMRRADYSQLRDTAQRMFERRLREACSAFTAGRKYIRRPADSTVIPARTHEGLQLWAA